MKRNSKLAEAMHANKPLRIIWSGAKFFLVLVALAIICAQAIAQEDTAEDWYKKGLELQRNGFYEDAVKAFDEAIELNSSHASAWNKKGSSLFEMGDYEGAIKAYDEALKIESDEFFTAGILQKKGITLEILERPEDAAEAYETAVEIADSVIVEYENSSDLINLSLAWEFKGQLLTMQGKYDEAFEACDNASKANPNKVVLWNSIGYLLGTELSRFNESIDAYNKALEIDPSNGVALKGKAKDLDAIGQHEEAVYAYSEALKYYNNVLKENPASSSNLIVKADILQTLGRYNESLEVCNIVLDIKPESYDALIVKAKALDSLGQHEEAIEAYNDSLKNFNLVEEAQNSFLKRAGTRIVKGDILRALGRYEEALLAYDEAIELNPTYMGAWHYRGLTLNALGRTSEAEVAFARAKELGYLG